MAMIILMIVCTIVGCMIMAWAEGGNHSTACDRVAAPANRPVVTVDKLKRKDSGRMASIVREAERRKASKVVPSVEYTGKLKWFVVERALATISPAEQLIVYELNKYHVKWYREIAFEGFMLTSYSYARYDFLIEVPGGIIIVEYDGVNWHQNEEQIARDKLKTAFCKKNKIPLVRYDKKDYYHMADRIEQLMAQNNIRKKILA